MKNNGKRKPTWTYFAPTPAKITPDPIISQTFHRRHFLQTAAASALYLATGRFSSAETATLAGTDRIKVGLCTYRWGENAQLPELLDALAAAGMTGIELRCHHKHGVEPELDASARREVKRRFNDAGITLVGFGTNEDFHHKEPEKVREHIERAKEYVRLSADCGASGIKVKPNDLPEGVAREKTTAQIAEALDELGEYAAGFGQVIRLENHGQCAPIPIMREIIEQVHAPNVGLCWNSNRVDLEAPGFEANLRSVLDRLADTAHICGTPANVYPYGDLCRILTAASWNGWLLIENGQPTENLTESLKATKAEFDRLLAAE